jgi:hypothetical protein
MDPVHFPGAGGPVFPEFAVTGAEKLRGSTPGGGGQAGQAAAGAVTGAAEAVAWAAVGAATAKAGEAAGAMS